MGKGRSPSYLVAGGAGFLGSHLCDALLADGAHVVALDNLLTGRRENIAHLANEPKFDLIEADIVHGVPVKSRAKFDGIYNLACAASPPKYQADPEHTLLTSVLGTRNLLHLAREWNARFFLASTSEVYGDPLVHPQREDYWGHVNPTGPRACYDEGKRAAETLTFDYDRLGYADVRVVRIFNTYGPRLLAEDGRVISNVVNQALAGNDVTVFGDGSQTRSFCFVDDMIDGFIRLMNYEGAQPGPVNIGNPVEWTVNELVACVLDLTGSKSKVVNLPLPQDDPQRRRPDITRAETLLGWSPKTSIQDGLKSTIAWYAAERERPTGVTPAAEPLAASA